MICLHYIFSTVVLWCFFFYRCCYFRNSLFLETIVVDPLPTVSVFFEEDYSLWSWNAIRINGAECASCMCCSRSTLVPNLRKRLCHRHSSSSNSVTSQNDHYKGSCISLHSRRIFRRSHILSPPCRVRRADTDTTWCPIVGYGIIHTVGMVSWRLSRCAVCCLLFALRCSQSVILTGFFVFWVDWIQNSKFYVTPLRLYFCWRRVIAWRLSSCHSAQPDFCQSHAIRLPGGGCANLSTLLSHPTYYSIILDKVWFHSSDTFVSLW